mmetsp:Transcript_14244/g.23713  ORF Transcript_14244/g.23713 Transcript_14244/m.23713 type:complete len:85 (-) Transcript_14244:777-1031(-)
MGDTSDSEEDSQSNVLQFTDAALATNPAGSTRTMQEKIDEFMQLDGDACKTRGGTGPSLDELKEMAQCKQSNTESSTTSVGTRS